jgi:hypothetical protein
LLGISINCRSDLNNARWGLWGGRAGKINHGRCQKIVNFEGEVVWSSFEPGNLLPGLTGNSEEEIEAFSEKYEKTKKSP